MAAPGPARRFCPSRPLCQGAHASTCWQMAPSCSSAASGSLGVNPTAMATDGRGCTSPTAPVAPWSGSAPFLERPRGRGTSAMSTEQILMRTQGPGREHLGAAPVGGYGFAEPLSTASQKRHVAHLTRPTSEPPLARQVEVGGSVTATAASGAPEGAESHRARAFRRAARCAARASRCAWRSLFGKARCSG